MYKNIIVIVIFSIIILLSLFCNIRFKKIYENQILDDEIIQNIPFDKNETNIDIDTLDYTWSIIIPKIELNAPISEGSDNRTLSKYVGHIENTGISSSNICLCGHTNTANYTNGNFYFDKLTELEIGDEIYYNYLSNIDKFKVENILVVDENNLSVLSPSENKKLTLITCIKGQYYNRLCIICNLDSN